LIINIAFIKPLPTVLIANEISAVFNYIEILYTEVKKTCAS